MSGQFIQSASGHILVVCHTPATQCREAVVVFPALAEEMNKSRRLLWALGQRLAAQGIMTVIPDLYGTGDSEGDFLDARWSDWCDDMRAAISWSQAQGVECVHALAVRMGACLLTDCRDSLVDAESRIATWQPEFDGAIALRQLLRLKVMSDRVTWGEKTNLKDLQSALESLPVEIGGYQFSPELAKSISNASFDWSAFANTSPKAFFDWARTNPATDEQQAEGIERYAMQGQRFWTAVEPEVNSTLTEITANFFSGRTS